MSAQPIYDMAPWRTYHKAGKEPQHRLNSLPELIHTASEKYAAQPAFTTCMPNGMNGQLTYSQVDEMSDAFAVYLRESVGLATGARVAVQMPNCLTLPVVSFGILKAGCVLVNVNPLYTPREMEHQFNDSGAEALIIIDMFADKLEHIVANTGVRQVVITSVAQFFPPIVKGVLKGVIKYWNRAIPKHNVEHDWIDEALNIGRETKQQKKYFR
jgi:long-chain acyl-CoA synthetase